AGSLIANGDLDMQTHIIKNIGTTNSTFTATGGLTLHDALTVSANGAAITGTTSVTGSTTLNGTLTQTGSGNAVQFAGNVAGTNGLDVTGAVVNLNAGATAASNFAVNVGSGTSMGAVTIGNSLNTLGVNAPTTITNTAAATALTVTGAAAHNIIDFKKSTGDSVLTLDNAATLTLGNVAQAIKGSLVLVDAPPGNTATVQAAPLSGNWVYTLPDTTANANLALNNIDNQFSAAQHINSALTVSGLITGSGGETITGAAVNLNAGTTAASNFAVNIASGTSTGAVSIGNAATPNLNLTGVAVGITGATTVTGTLTSTDKLKVNTNGAEIVAGGLAVDAGGATIAGTTGITGATTITGALTNTGGTVNVNADSPVAPTAFAVNISSGNTTGAVTIGNASNSIALDAPTTINKNVTLSSTGSAVATAVLNQGSLTFNNASDQTFTISNTDVVGKANLSVEGSITAGSLIANGDLDMQTHIIKNIGTTNSTFTATGGLTLHDALTVSAGGATITGATGITGTTTINTTGTATTSIGNASGTLTLTGSTVGVTGNTTVTGTLTSTDKLTVNTNGAEILLGGLAVDAGGATITGATTITGGAINLDAGLVGTSDFAVNIGSGGSTKDVTIGSASNNVKLNAPTTITGTTQINGGTTVIGALTQKTGNVSLNSDVATAATTVDISSGGSTGYVKIGNAATPTLDLKGVAIGVTGATTVTGTLAVTGLTTTHGIDNSSSVSGIANAGPIAGATTIGASGLITGTGGATISGAAINLNANDSHAVNIATGTSSGAVKIGTDTASGGVTVGNAANTLNLVFPGGQVTNVISLLTPVIFASSAVQMPFATDTTGNDITVTGAAVGDDVLATPPSTWTTNTGAGTGAGDGFLWKGYVVAPNTVRIRIVNFSGTSPANPNADNPQTWRVTVVKH
ncbi:MAG TPA: hypothetical protein VKX17_25035, partial [Planctomycetota bacterium]|nr:hypothetical protein [Planctomycetota bacterium]